jgi:hypothetical protein
MLHPMFVSAIGKRRCGRERASMDSGAPEYPRIQDSSGHKKTPLYSTSPASLSASPAWSNHRYGNQNRAANPRKCRMNLARQEER